MLNWNSEKMYPQGRSSKCQKKKTTTTKKTRDLSLYVVNMFTTCLLCIQGSMEQIFKSRISGQTRTKAESTSNNRSIFGASKQDLTNPLLQINNFPRSAAACPSKMPSFSLSSSSSSTASSIARLRS